MASNPPHPAPSAVSDRECVIVHHPDDAEGAANLAAHHNSVDVRSNKHVPRGQVLIFTEPIMPIFRHASTAQGGEPS